MSVGRTTVHRAISVPLTPVTKGLSRSLADTPNRRSGHVEAGTAQIPELKDQCEFCWLAAHWGVVGTG